MKKLSKKPCQMCGEIFLPKRSNNTYCQRRCFKLANYRLHREDNKNKFPVFNCPTCHFVINLDFNPIKKPQAWLQFKCPNCNVLMVNIVDIVKVLDVQVS